MGHFQRLKSIEWSKNWGWQMFNVNLACGALSVVINSIPYNFRGQHAIGCIFYLANVVIYIFNLGMTCRRIYRWPKVFHNSFYDQKEAVWFPVTGVAMATLIIGTLLYGGPYTGPWLPLACEIWFWIYVFLAACIGLIMQTTFRTIGRPLSEIGPPDALEVYPLMFIGVVGSTLASELVDYGNDRALTVAIFSYIFVGLGFFVGLLKLSVWMHKDMISAKADPGVVPSYLISVGVPGFPSLALVNLANCIQDIAERQQFLSGLPGTTIVSESARIFETVSVLLSFLLVGMAAWMLIVFLGWALISLWQEPKKPIWERWQFTWWSWTFPLTGIVVAFGRLATFIPAKAFGILNIIFVIGMACVFCLNITGTARMIWQGSLPGSANEFDGQWLKRAQEGHPDKMQPKYA